MVNINCKVKDKMKLSAMKPLQGVLKKRSQADIDALKQSLENEGLMQPFAMWGEYILDGHGRYTALMQMGYENEDVPIIPITAGSLDEARQRLLVINTKYGRITPCGLEAFIANSSIKIPERLGVTVPQRTITIDASNNPNNVASNKPKTRIIKLKVDIDKCDDFLNVIKELNYVKVL